MLFGEGDFSGAENEGVFSLHLHHFPQTVGLGEEVGQSIHDGGNKQNKWRENISGKMRNIVGILQGDNYAGYCFVLRVLIPINFFKLVVIIKLK